MPSQEFPDEHVDRTSVCNELFLPLASSSSCIQMTDMVLLKKNYSKCLFPLQTIIVYPFTA